MAPIPHQAWAGAWLRSLRTNSMALPLCTSPLVHTNLARVVIRSMRVCMRLTPFARTYHPCQTKGMFSLVQRLRNVLEKMEVQFRVPNVGTKP